MKLVFIFTENGNVYSDEGMNYIREKLRINCQETGDLVFMAGSDLNDVKTAIGLLEDHVSDGYAVISRADGIDYMPSGKGMEALAKILRKYGGKNAWTAITFAMDQALAELLKEDPNFKARIAK